MNSSLVLSSTFGRYDRSFMTARSTSALTAFSIAALMTLKKKSATLSITSGVLPSRLRPIPHFLQRSEAPLDEAQASLTLS
jgi:hypothetical protein